MNTENEDLISVVLPVYNGEQFVCEAIESILSSQTNTNFELIIIDDGSTDNTKNILHHFSKDPRQVNSFKDFVV